MWMLTRRSFAMTTELVAHGRQQPTAEVTLATRRESLEERRRQYRRRRCAVDRRVRRPASFAGIRDAALELLQGGIGGERPRGEIEQPRANHAAMTPELRDVGERKIVLEVLRIAKRRSVVTGGTGGADIRVSQEVEALRI